MNRHTPCSLFFAFLLRFLASTYILESHLSESLPSASTSTTAASNSESASVLPSADAGTTTMDFINPRGSTGASSSSLPSVGSVFRNGTGGSLQEPLQTPARRLAEQCGIWLGPSTIPNAGLGMFAGRPYKDGEWLQQPLGDIAIPIVDLRFHSGDDDFVFLWDEYTWNAENLHMDAEGYHDIHVASPGFGSAANCFLSLQNVDEWNPYFDDAGLHRARDPGAGALSQYGNRTTTATRDISPGEELFVSYGEGWFIGREFLGAVPLTKDLERASELFQSFLLLRDKAEPKTVIDGVWETFVQNHSWKESRVLGAFNHGDPEELERLHALKNMTELRTLQSMRDLDWLQEHGVCGDHIGVGRSALWQAGRGAFARRDLPQGTIVTNMPLIHVPDRTVFEMYHFHPTRKRGGKPAPDPSLGVSSYQLLTNYCFGHKFSTMLLCPYGPQAGYINHNRTLANVKLVWGDPARGNHQPKVLKMPLELLKGDYSAKLSMDVIALRDIGEGEEILLDYGVEWEAAWQEHVKSWKPVAGADTYVSGHNLNKDQSRPLRTEFELLKDPIPNVELWCSNSYLSPRWKDYYPSRLDEFTEEVSGQTYPCDVLRYRRDDHGNYLYTAVLWQETSDETKSSKEIIGKLVDVPRQALTYYDKPYTTDTFLPNAFRHDIRIPDDLFPLAWRNLDPPQA